VLTEAQIEIVDEAGRVEDRVRIVGAGEVALATQGRSRLEVAPDDPASVDAVITLRDGYIYVEAKKHQALRVDDAFLPAAAPREVQRGLIALIVAVRRHLHVRAVVDPAASLMSPAGAVIRDQPSDLMRWSAEAAARGVARVSEHLARLRARGMIDEGGRLLVPPPDDMSPGSKTDV
jgi:hypothetical protein